jgi:hypothetical protein
LRELSAIDQSSAQLIQVPRGVFELVVIEIPNRDPNRLFPQLRLLPQIFRHHEILNIVLVDGQDDNQLLAEVLGRQFIQLASKCRIRQFGGVNAKNRFPLHPVR